ncbi:unnamed protein product [Chrysodeixis includens]|uniref:Uncharacterized protein n=1 Tax=Chrysodeixis includens TaxID=689277 RepID=A0A9P0BUE3_CHRIL|nr:unnamed protein product [Chrysodeixis includens]
MLKFIKNIAIRAVSLKIKLSVTRSSFSNKLAMTSEELKKKSDLILEHEPVKKVKMASDDAKTVMQRTVATMCGAWRPEEEYGGLIFVFKTREACLSPDPTNEADYPENIKDFWEATFQSSDDEQC